MITDTEKDSGIDPVSGDTSSARDQASSRQASAFVSISISGIPSIPGRGHSSNGRITSAGAVIGQSIIESSR